MLLTFDSDMFDTLVHIEVGADTDDGHEKRTFEIFKGVLTFYSGYFQAALSKSWHEAQTNTVKLTEEDPLVFSLFVSWIHTRRFYESTLAPTLLMNFTLLAKLWVFGDAYDVPLLQNTAMDFMVQKCTQERCFFDAESVRYIWFNTVETSKLRKLLIHGMESIELSALSGDSSRLEVGDLDDITWAIHYFKNDRRCCQALHTALDNTQCGCMWHVHRKGTTCIRCEETQNEQNAGDEKADG